MVYADVANYLVTITALMFLTEENVRWAGAWTAANWATGGGGGLVWTMTRVFLNTDFQ